MIIAQGKINTVVESTSKLNLNRQDTIFFNLPTDGGFYEWEEMPLFPGGDTALINFVKRNTIYPISAINDSIEGIVIIRFAIEDDGSIAKASVLKSVRSDLDLESIRVVNKLPLFKPGRSIKEAKKGWYWTNVEFWYIISFNYSLSNHGDKRGILITPK